MDEEDSGQVQLLITGSPSAGITPSFPIILDLGIQTISKLLQLGYTQELGGNYIASCDYLELVAFLWLFLLHRK